MSLSRNGSWARDVSRVPRCQANDDALMVIPLRCRHQILHVKYPDTGLCELEPQHISQTNWPPWSMPVSTLQPLLLYHLNLGLQDLLLLCAQLIESHLTDSIFETDTDVIRVRIVEGSVTSRKIVELRSPSRRLHHPSWSERTRL